jgi:hypothetical protein
MIPPPHVTVDGQAVDVAGMNQPPVDLLALAQDKALAEHRHDPHDQERHRHGVDLRRRV